MFSYKLNNSNNFTIVENNNCYLIPLGHRCSSAIVCKHANLRKFSLPFDWTIPLYPSNVKKVLENDFQDFIPDVHNNIFTNKYNFCLAHFNTNIDEGINEYKRRIDRFNNIINEGKKIYFVYVNEDYLYNNNYRSDEFNDNIFSQMLELELFLKQKYANINYNILYFDFKQHNIPSNSNIINIVLSSTILYNLYEEAPWTELRIFCGSILSYLFNSQLQYQLCENLDELFNS
jgi:hypothetical protein